MSRPGKTNGLRHVAIFVLPLEDTVRFYTELLGMEIEWQPDDDNYYLTSGNDNLALHRARDKPASGVLDHIGFFINEKEMVDTWFAHLKGEGVTMLTEPKDHRDGARSFYCLDPAGTRVQLIYHIPIAACDS